MIDRRTFLKASLAVCALPALTLAPSSWASAYSALMVIDAACGDGRAFARGCGVGHSTRPAIARILDQLARDGRQHCFGLTRDSDYFVIAQMARALGYHAGYHGVHDYRDGGLQHRLRGAHQVITELATAFSLAGKDWTRSLADAVPALLYDVRDQAQIQLKTASARPADSGGYLVSWCLHRA